MLQGRIFSRDGDGARAATTYLRAYQVSGIDDIATRLTILEPLCEALKQQRRWDDLARRAHDAQRLAPDDPRWPRAERDALASLNRAAERCPSPARWLTGLTLSGETGWRWLASPALWAT